jgi:hypothetical protein
MLQLQFLAHQQILHQQRQKLLQPQKHMRLRLQQQQLLLPLLLLRQQPRQRHSLQLTVQLQRLLIGTCWKSRLHCSRRCNNR